MKRNFSKIKIIAVTSALIIPASLLCLAACGEDGETDGEVSELIGRFTSSSDERVILTNNRTLIGGEDDDERPYIYTSDVYPLNTIESEEVNYTVSQTLRLKRDYTYEYAYDVTLRKVTQNGNTELTKLEVDYKGVFEYEAEGFSETMFAVKLESPTDGYEQRYGATIADEGNIYSWRLNPRANFRINVEDAQYDELSDRYLTGKTVRVERGEERVLYDNVFFADILNDIAPFCNYTQTNGGNGGTVEPEPPEPEQAAQGVTLPAKEIDGANVSLYIGATPEAVVKTAEGETRTAISFKDFATAVNLPAGQGTVRFVATDYVKSFIGVQTDDLLEGKSLEATAISLLNYAKLQGAQITLTPEQSALVYDSLGNNRYHSDFGSRDNIDREGGSVQGFDWDGLPALKTQNGAALSYGFSVNAGEYLRLAAKYTLCGKEYTVPVIHVKDEGGKSYYTAETELISPLLYDETVSLQILDNVTEISETAGYSVTRAVAKADLSDDAQVKESAKAVYSLGKSAVWYQNRESAVYSYDPPEINGNGSYSLTIGAYTYNDSRMNVTAEPISTWGNSLYMGGTLTSDTVSESTGNGFTATKNGNGFNITLNGASVDGIRPSNDGAGSISLTVAGDSELTRILKAPFGDPSRAATLKSFADLTVTGQQGAVLNIYGNVFAAGKLTVENVTVNVICPENVTAVECEELEISNGGLNVEYIGKQTASASGIVCGTANVNGSLGSVGFLNGIYLSNDSAGITVTGGGLDIEAMGIGITGGIAEDGANKIISIAGGESYIRGASGLNVCDLTVGAGSLTAIADNGFTVSAESRPNKISTTSGDKNTGELKLYNYTYNPFWDVNYTVKTGDLSLDGGNVYVYGMCKDGVIHTTLGANITVKNCDLMIENGQDQTTSYGRGINAQSGDEVITVENTAKVIFKNCDAPIACWSKSGGSSFAVLQNNGLIILDNYKVGLQPWELGSWQLQLTVEGNGQVRA